MKYTLGTVCKLKGIDMELIIIGYNSKSTSNKYIYEYAACLLNEGFINSEKLYRFNGEHIETILYEGYNKKKLTQQIEVPAQNETKKEQQTTSNSDKEEYIFDENGVLIEIKRPTQKQETEEPTQIKHNTSTPVTLESIDINDL